nr:MAG TPA: hypothetical protein [Inoviridae sp.]
MLFSPVYAFGLVRMIRVCYIRHRTLKSSRTYARLGMRFWSVWMIFT